MTSCTHCDKELPAGLTLCNEGANDLRRILLRTRETLNTAGGTLANMAVAPPSDGGNGASSEGPGLPYSLDMSEHVRDYQAKIRKWASLIGEAQNKPTPVDTIEAASFLRMHMGLIRGNDHANIILQELRGAERKVINAADRQAPKLLLGECGTLQWVEDSIAPCAGQVIGREGDDQAKCDTCQTHHSASERTNAKLAQAWHVLAPLPEVLRALKAYGTNIRYATARQWVHRGKIAPICDIRTRQEGYSPAAVLKAMPTKTTNTRQLTVQELPKVANCHYDEINVELL